MKQLALISGSPGALRVLRHNGEIRLVLKNGRDTVRMTFPERWATALSIALQQVKDNGVEVEVKP